MQNRRGELLLTLVLLTLLCALAASLARSLLPFPKESAAMEAEEQIRPLILLDPGHGGEDAGAVSQSGITEKELNLDTALLLRDLLSLLGYDVLLTRSTDVLLYDPSSDHHGHKKEQDLATRLKAAQEHPDALFVSLHMNAFTDPRYSGLQVWYSPNDPRSALYALGVQSTVCEVLQPENTRRIKEAGSNLFLLDRITSPAILIECGFLSNPEEAAKLSDPAYRKTLALLIALSIAKCAENAGAN